MKNFKQQGQTIELIAPAAGVTGGQPLTQDGFTGVVSATAKSGEKFELVLGGVFTFPKASSLFNSSNRRGCKLHMQMARSTNAVWIRYCLESLGW